LFRQVFVGRYVATTARLSAQEVGGSPNYPLWTEDQLFPRKKARHTARAFREVCLLVLLRSGPDHGFMGQIVVPASLTVDEFDGSEAHLLGVIGNIGVYERVDVAVADTRPFHLENIAGIAGQLDLCIDTPASELILDVGGIGGTRVHGGHCAAHEPGMALRLRRRHKCEGGQEQTAAQGCEIGN